MNTSKLFRNIGIMLLVAFIYSLIRIDEPLKWKLIIGVNAVSYLLIGIHYHDTENGGKWLENRKIMIKLADMTIDAENKIKELGSLNTKKEEVK